MRKKVVLQNLAYAEKQIGVKALAAENVVNVCPLKT